MSNKFHSKPFQSTKEEIKHKTSKHGYTLAFTDQNFLVREELRPVRLQLELLRPELIMQDYGVEETIVFFGSARLPDPAAAQQALKQAQLALTENPNDARLQFKVKQAERIKENSAYLEEATKLAYLISTDPRSTFIVATGGGPSFMEAANKGAYQAKARSAAFNITLPFEQESNIYVTPELTFQFHYFALRKMHFLIRAKALISFPGGFGTLDELFEVLTLMQNQKIEKMPILLFHEKFWRRIVNFEALIEEGTISPEDLELIQYTETAEHAWKVICDFYQLT
ncbi:MAG: LOG family protein [Gammaproteobacteria bacterium]